MRLRVLSALSLWLALLLPVLAQSPIASFPQGMFANRSGLAGVSGAPMVGVILLDPTTAVSTTATSYYGISGGVATTTPNVRNIPSPIAGTIANLRVRFPTALAGGTSYVLTLLVNGSPAGSPGNVSCTIDSANATCSDTTNTATISAGDLLSWQIVPSGTPAAQTVVQIAATLTSTANGQGALFSANQTAAGGNPSSAAANYGPIGAGSIIWTATEANVATVAPTGGAIDGLYVKVVTAPGAGKSSAFTLYKNGSSTGLTCTVSDANTSCSDPIGGGHSVSVSAGDTLSLEHAPTGTPATATVRYSVGWLPTISGEQMIATSGGGSLNQVSARYFNVLTGGSPGISSTETNVLAVAPVASTLKKLIVQTDAALSGAQTRVHISRKGTGAGQSNGNVTCTLNSTNTVSCSDGSNSDSLSAGDLINWSTTPSNTPPATTYYRASAVITVP